MKKLTTEEFCRKFVACTAGMRFALRYKTMRECYTALLAGEAGDKSAEWAIWAATRDGVMSDRDLRLFAVRCARRVQHLMTDQRSIDALDVAERYAKGEATEDELTAARTAAHAAVDATDAAHAAAWDAAVAAAREARAAVDVTYANYASYASYAAANFATYAAAWNAGPYTSLDAAWIAARAAERREQLKILAEFGNPFGEDCR